jgi:glycosyltransferase involved in cell wall biosynthesis
MVAAVGGVLGITSIFGSPNDRRTWSGAPANVAKVLEKRGIKVTGIDASLSRLQYTLFAGLHLLSLYGRFQNTEAISRGLSARRSRAETLARNLKRMGIQHVLHTGTLDMPPTNNDVSHYLYCDHTWDLSLRHRTDVNSYTERAVREFDELERQAYEKSSHIFTFGDYVRQNLISHYGIPESRVTAVGSGMGSVEPYYGPKDYSQGRLLFIAKHLFFEKGGHLLLDAFKIAVKKKPKLSLTIVGSPQGQRLASKYPNVDFRSFIPWTELESLLRQSSLLVQPMLNDPWGQVYLEAMISRTPVMGLNRNGLPEIVQNGRFGFVVDSDTPEALAEAIIDATSDSDRLEQMGQLGQQHVLDHYSWDIVGQRMVDVIGRDVQHA